MLLGVLMVLLGVLVVLLGVLMYLCDAFTVFIAH